MDGSSFARRASTLTRVVMLTAWCVAVGSGGMAFAQPSAPGSPLSPEIQRQIQELKLAALDAYRVDDLEKARECYEHVLRLNVDDATALERLEAIDRELKRREDERRRRVIVDSDQQNRSERAARFVDQARRAVAEAKRTGAAAPLEAAKARLADARRLVTGSNADIDAVERLVQLESERQRTRRWEAVAVLGAALLAAILGLVWYVWWRTRVLEVIEGPEVGRVVALRQPTTTVGALGSEVDWPVNDPMRRVSRHHCDVVRQGRHHFLVDCSTNGTALNGRRLHKGEPVLLRGGDRIELSGDIVVRFR